MSPEDFLEWEAAQETRHEYVGGMVYTMAGGVNRHHAVATSVLGLLYGQLRGQACRPFNSDTKVRVQYPTHTRFYYPDVMVLCGSWPPEQHFQDNPTIIVEVASPSTRRTDELEKRDAYQTIPTLQVYIFCEQDSAAAVVWRWGSQGFAREVYAGLDAVIELPEVGARLLLAEVYESLRFA